MKTQKTLTPPAESLKRLDYFLRSPGYILAVLLTAMLCYGYSVINITLSIDGLEGSRYIGEGQIMLAAGRFGMKLLAALLGYGYATPVYQPAANLIAVLLLVLASIQFCMLFRRIWGDRISLFGYGAFSCLLVSYPLINEIWEYTGANVSVCAGYFLSAAGASLLYDLLHTPGLSARGKTRRFFLATLGLLVVVSAYESLAFVYVFTVFALLSMQQLAGERLSVKQTFHRGLVYAAALAVAVALRLIIHRSLLVMLNLSPQTGGATKVYWTNGSFWDVFTDLVKDCILYYGMRACFYLPILELVLAIVLFLCLLVAAVLRLRRPALALTGFGMLLSLVLLSVVQGIYSPYRTCQVFAVMVAVTGMAVYEVVRHWDRGRLLTRLCGCLLALLCLHQSTYLSHLLVLDHQRSEEEAVVIRTIGTDLQRDFSTDKPVIMVGEYSLSQGIVDQVTAKAEDNPFYEWFQTQTRWENDSTIKYVDTNVNSVINWATTAFAEHNSIGSSMQKLFQYYGFDLLFEVDPLIRQEALDYAAKTYIPAFPKDGYIVERPEYILVNLSTEEN